IVVLAIIGILFALLLPAVQAVRESGRRLECASNLRQLSLAVHQYEQLHGVLPRAMRKNYSFHVALLPHLEQQSLFRQFDFSINQTDYQGNLQGVRVAIFQRPSDASSRVVIRDWAATSYFGNCGSGSQRYGYNGVFGYRLHPHGGIDTLTSSSISDGLSNTAMFSEVLAADGSYHWLRVYWLAPALGGKDQLDQFAQACANLPDSAPNSFTDNLWCGRPWIRGGITGTLYNHVLGPNSPSCLNGASIDASAFSSASFHGSVVNVANADGSVQSVNQAIDLVQWRRLASRSGSP
ncbi:MAG TPA: DUF1559 domain-containing protein, partial [Pirellulaceae bacterium]|nr:DUF1559 domain-containing protein [Pirellulaceae bacterium]